MKSRFTNIAKKAIVSFCILSVAAIGSLQAQNSAYGSGNQNNTEASSAQMTAGSPGTSMKIVLDQNSSSGDKVLSGRLILSNDLHNIKEIENVSATLDFDPASIDDPTSLQFDLGQADLTQLYKLLALYKSEAGQGGHTIVSLSRKNQSGKAVDSIYIFFKYVVADDLSGFFPGGGATSVEPVIVGAKISSKDIGALVPNSITASPTNQTEALEHPDFSGLISLYPNPAQNSITVDLSTVSGFAIRIFDMQGKLVKTVPSLLNIPQHKIDIADLPSGFYILNIDTQNGPVQKEFSKIN